MSENLVKRLREKASRYNRELLDEAADAIERLTPAKGVWLPQRLLGESVVDCSKCKTLGSPHWNFCPICGADMRKEVER